MLGWCSDVPACCLGGVGVDPAVLCFRYWQPSDLTQLFSSPQTLLLPPVFPAAAYSVKTILQSIQSLLADPNVDSPLNAHAAKLWGVNDAEYRALVQKAYNGPKHAT